MSINVRRKGKAFERKIAVVWMRLFGGEVERSSFVNKKLDDQGVDLIGTDPFSIQCKAVERSIDMHSILQSMPQDTNINVVVHKRNHQPPVACMTFEDFCDLVQMLKNNNNL